MKLKKALSLVLAVLMIVSTMTFVTVTTAADGNVAKIGTTEYATLDAALDAAKDGDTITLIADATYSATKAVKVNVTIDGAGHKLTGGTGYLWQFYNGATIKNLTVESTHGFRFRYNPDHDTAVTLENTTWTITKGLLVNIQSNDDSTKNVGGKKQTFTMINSTVNKPTDGTAGDPIIATYTNKATETDPGTDVDINLLNTKITTGSNATNWGNLATFYLSASAKTTVNLMGNTEIYNAPTKHSSNWTSVFSASIPVTVNVDSTVKITHAPTSADSTKSAFFNGNDRFTINDAGATWIMSNTALTQGTALATGMKYNGADVTAVATKEAGATETTMQFTAEGAKTYVARIGATGYETIDAALDAAKDGDTVYIMTDATSPTNTKQVMVNVTIDGSYHTITGPEGYAWAFYNGGTIKNATIKSRAGFRHRYNPANDTELILENVTWELTKGLLANIQSNDKDTGNAGGKRHDLTLINCNISKPLDGTAADPLIATYSNSPTDTDPGALVKVTVQDSILTNASTSNHIGNIAVFYFFNSAQTTLDLKGNTVINYAPAAANGAKTAMISTTKPVTVNIEETVTLNYVSVVKAATENYFFYGDNLYTINDAGATYTAGNAVIEQGLAIPKGLNYNGKNTVATYVKEAGETESKVGFVTMNEGDVALNAGASIRTDAPNAISFSGTIDKAFYDQLLTLDKDTTVTMYLVTKENLDKVMQDGAPNLDLIAERNKLQFNKILLTDSTDGNSKIFRGCYYGVEDVKQEYAVIAYVTYYLGNVKNQITVTFSEEDHVRSVYEVATKAVADTKYANNEYLKAIASAS